MEKICQVESCDRPHSAKGFCGAHYARYRRGVDVDKEPIANRQYEPDICAYEDCGRPRGISGRQGMCQGHYLQLLRGEELRPIALHIKRSDDGMVQSENGRICEIESCDRPHYAKGLCNGHWQRARRGVDLNVSIAERYESDVCSYPDCGRVRVDRGLCQTHYKQLLAGEELRPIQLQVKQGDECWVPGCTNASKLKGGCQKHRHISRFHLNRQQVERLYNDPRCMICGVPPGERALHIDHDHSCCAGYGSCGKCVRGLLCMACNNAIGLMRDDVERLRSAIKYLEQTDRI